MVKKAKTMLETMRCSSSSFGLAMHMETAYQYKSVPRKGRPKSEVNRMKGKFLCIVHHTKRPVLKSAGSLGVSPLGCYSGSIIRCEKSTSCYVPGHCSALRL